MFQTLSKSFQTNFFSMMSFVTIDRFMNSFIVIPKNSGKCSFFDTHMTNVTLLGKHRNTWNRTYSILFECHSRTTYNISSQWVCTFFGYRLFGMRWKLNIFHLYLVFSSCFDQYCRVTRQKRNFFFVFIIKVSISSPICTTPYALLATLQMTHFIHHH